ncbi:MAG: class I SAM-dependent methyltransferase [Anaerolineales bacterium]|jgi:SAM-dependent methyltransferase
MIVIRVKNETVWQGIRVLFLASALLYLANITFGFDNALATEMIPRWQTLVHAHAGTLGWVTLSALGLTLWFFTGEREVTGAYTRRVKALSRFAIAVFTGYVLSFGLAFGLGRPWFYLMPIFGVAALLVIWAAAIFALLELRQQPVVATTHLLVTAGLFVAALGSTVGMLLGLEYIVGFFVPGADRIGAHAAVMDAYVLLFAAAIVEGFLGKEQVQRWTWAGLGLSMIWGLAGILVLLGLLFDFALGQLFVPFLLLGLVLFMARTGWRALRINPLGRGPERWLFFGTLWAVLWALFFIYIGATYAEDLASIPDWVGAIFQHAAFVGTMTNLLLGVYSVRSQDASYVMSWGETASLWLINLGLLAFFGLHITIDSSLGAIVMGSGVLLGVVTMLVRLLMSDLSWAYELLYRDRAPWDMDEPRPELVRMVESGQFETGRAIDLGCGSGDNAIYLAQQGFEVIGVDLSPRAITRAREKAGAAGVSPTFIAGDVTDLKEVSGTFDLVLDYGCLGCVIGLPTREKYAKTLRRLTQPGSKYILLNFAQGANRRFNLIPNTLQPGEAERLFGDDFEIEYYDGEHETGPLGMRVEFRLMRRK